MVDTRPRIAQLDRRLRAPRCAAAKDLGDWLAGIVSLLTWLALFLAAAAAFSFVLLPILPDRLALIVGCSLGFLTSMAVLLCLQVRFSFFSRGAWTTPFSGAGAGTSGVDTGGC